jgi:hypothetical protein
MWGNSMVFNVSVSGELVGIVYVLVWTTIGSAVNDRGDRSYDMQLPGMFWRSFLSFRRWVMAY